MATHGWRRVPAIACALLGVAALVSGCSKTSTVSAASAPSAAAAPVVQKRCADHLAASDTARQTEIGDSVAALGLPSVAPDLGPKVDAACQANPDSSLSSVVRGIACSKAGASTTIAPPTSAPGAARIDPRPMGLAVGHPARAGGGHGGGKSSGGSRSSGSSGGSSSGGSSGGSSSGGSSSSGHSSSGSSSSGSSSSGSSGSANACG